MSRPHTAPQRIPGATTPPAAAFAIALAMLVLAAAAPPAAARGIAAHRDGPHPDAPPETAQFAFLVGEWRCVVRSMAPDGTLGPPSEATWAGHWILDGWAIQDVWTSKTPSGGTFHGTNIRSFNPEAGRWDNRWLASGSLEWKYFSAEKVGDTMVMTGGEGTDPRGPFVDRNVFHSIGADAWKWRKDRSWDGGATWLEGVATIEATRAP